jgi:hypothetical protein
MLEQMPITEKYKNWIDEVRNLWEFWFIAAEMYIFITEMPEI